MTFRLTDVSLRNPRARAASCSAFKTPLEAPLMNRTIGIYSRCGNCQDGAYVDSEDGPISLGRYVNEVFGNVIAWGPAIERLDADVLEIIVTRGISSPVCKLFNISRAEFSEFRAN